jgi:hypothetical protein
MSRLVIKTTYAGDFTMNVLKFSAPMFGTMLSGQTKRATMYFPIKAQQPELELDVIFVSVAEYMRFQDFVRATQLNGLSNDVEPGITLWWPQRNITNWTGVIRNFRAGGERFVYAPKARLTIDLIDSFVSTRTTITSVAPIFDTVYGLGMPDGVFKPPPSAVPQTPGTVPLGPGRTPGGGVSAT